MIKRLLDSKLPLMVYSPYRVFDIAYYRNIFAAGGLPVLDTEFMTDAEIEKNIEKLAAEKILFGLRLSIDRQNIQKRLKEQHVGNLDAIVFSYQRAENLSAFNFDNRDYKFFVESTDINISVDLERIGPHGLILKGNEAPGKISAYTSFVLMQWYLENSDFPIFIHGGVGWHTAPGMFAAGVSGVVLDDQLYLSKESPLSDGFKDVIAHMEEKDSVVIGQTLNTRYRFFSKLGTKIVKTLKAREIFLADTKNSDEMLYDDIQTHITALDTEGKTPLQRLFYLGQDAIFARYFVRQSHHLRDIIRAFFKNIDHALAMVDVHDPMVPGSPLAKEHGTGYPIIQGPMANVSDTPEFSQKILENGGLPFLALSSLPVDLAEKMLIGGKEKLSIFGAGLIGIETFNQTIDQHLNLVKKYKVPFALFAGGTPSQVRELEAAGTKTYLHTPSVMMLENAIAHGCRRFIFEGGEAGGHVGDLTSLVLWEAALEHVMDLPGDQLEQMRLVFAGGIGTRHASCFITGVASMLAGLGAKVGIQVGSSYLFTREIVDTGAIKKLYQDVVCKAGETILLGSTVGLVSRTVATPFSKKMTANEHERLRDQMPLAERKKAFEKENIGSLLIGAKAFCPDFEKMGQGSEVCFAFFDEDEQYARGNFMVGDSLAFDTTPVTIADIHCRYFDEKKVLRQNLNALEIFSARENRINDEIAVIGMGCVYPDADNTAAFWENIISKKCSIGPMPASRLDPDLYFDTDKNAKDKTYTTLAGFVADFNFDYQRFGYTREKADKLSRSQQMVLHAAFQAVDDAGYLEDNSHLRSDIQSSTGVIVATCLSNELSNDLHLKYYYPEIRSHLDQIEEFVSLGPADQKRLLAKLKTGMANGHDFQPVHGSVLNIEASRIAHHLGITGVNYVVDAACATSFAAMDCAARELLSGSHDMLIVGGVNTNLTPESFVGFSKMGTLSANGSFPFDERADGFILGEGAGVIVLKRMKDALRDKDRIYGTIKGMGSSSDGKGKAIAAPSEKGQTVALERCFENIRTDVTAGDIDYVEAHGTATMIGDKVELKTLKNIYGNRTPIGISSVKSQIGHLLGGAGMAGVIKVLLALSHKILPPNGGYEKSAGRLNIENSGLYIIENAMAWKRSDDKPRRAGVSSYGFGGINYHCVVEEYTRTYQPLPREIFKDPDYDFNDDRIVIAGLGVVLPGAKNIEAFWDRLRDGKSMVSQIPESRFHNRYYAKEDDPDYTIPMVKAGIVEDYRFDNVKYKIPPMTARSVDRAQLFALDAASQAIEKANLMPQLTFGNKTAVILGTISGEKYVENVMRTRIPFVEKVLTAIEGLDGKTMANISRQLANRLRERYVQNSEDTIPGLLSNIVSARISKHFGCNGANFVVDASCASSTVAIDLAVKGLKSKDYEYVITGGADANLYPAVMLAFKRLSLLANGGESRFFDNTSDGYIMGEGAAVQVITTYKNAVKNNMPILGEINGLALTSSAPGHLLSPSERAYKGAMEACYHKIPVNKNQVAHLDVFGVSNAFLDAMEKQAIEASFKDKINFGNIKPEFGYFKAANPAVVLTKLMLMNQHKTVLPNNSYRDKTSLVTKDSVLTPASRIVDAGSNHSLHFAANVNGIGGIHGHMVVGVLPEHLMAGQMPATVSDTNAAAQQNRMGKMPAPLRRQISPAISITTPIDAVKGSGLVALLSGQGAQHGGMMAKLYASEGVIRSIMDQGEAVFHRKRGYSLLDIMFGDDNRLNLTENTQPAVFLSSAAIHEYLHQKGFEPDAYIGHSVGEYTALFCAGILDFEPAMELIIKRADLMAAANRQVSGKIMVVFHKAPDVADFIVESGITEIYVTNKNSDQQTAVSGRSKNIEDFCLFLKQKGVLFKKLALSGAFHTPLFNDAARQLGEFLKNLPFASADYTRVISNVTARPYPQDEQAVKELLVSQIVSPVEFIDSVQRVAARNLTDFIEIGPGKLLVNLLKNIPMGAHHCLAAVETRLGQAASLKRLTDYLVAQNHLSMFEKPKPVFETLPISALAAGVADDAEFDAFVLENDAALKKLMYEAFLKTKRAKSLQAIEKFNFNTGRIVVAGVSVGLPGTGNRVFNDDNFDRILAGTNFIEPLSRSEKEKILDMNITRVFKEPDGNARLLNITSVKDVIQLAGKLGYFDLKTEYGIDYNYDITISLAIAAGIEALKDARIPLVQQYRQTSHGSRIPDGFALPEAMQQSTGIILTSLFPGFETLITKMNNYYYNKFYVKPYKELENIYYHLMAEVTDETVKEQVTDWFFKIKERRKKYGTYKFDRNLLYDIVPLGSAHFAQLIKAKGPNIQMSGACASTTQAVGVAEDWIRTGRCERVIVIGGEAATSEVQSPWIASGFLALGAASVKDVVADGAKPFDADRNGTILGSGAVSLVIEQASSVQERGLNGQAEILGTYIGNSAFHATRIDVDHLSGEMNGFMSGMEKRHGLQRKQIAKSMVFMSHETYTPARGGSADAEIAALRKTFGQDSREITITNTKGFTGHTLGAAIEDAVLVKALQKSRVPPIANLKKVPPEFADLKLIHSGQGDFRFGLHFSAGFGSHFAFLFIKRVTEKGIENNAQYYNWLKQISGYADPVPVLHNNTLYVAKSPDEKVSSESVGAPAEEKPDSSSRDTGVENIRKNSATAQETDEALIKSVQGIIALQTGYTEDMLAADLDLEADLGIDTVKQVEVFGKISNHFNLPVPEDLKLRELNTIARLADYIAGATRGSETGSAGAVPVAEESNKADSSVVLSTIRDIIALQTGYTEDMLAADLDLEADLGIDTVKQVEVFGKISNHFNLPVPEDLKLRELNTIARLADYIAGATRGSETGSAEAATVAGESNKADSSVILSTIRDIIALQTGYTEDMLAADLDLEADLGIDTVKQVEVFGKISNHFNLPVPEDLKLRELNTIARLADYIGNTAGKEVPMETSPESIPEQVPVRSVSGVNRFVVQADAVPLPEDQVNIFEDHTFLITLDRFGFADAIKNRIKSFSGHVLTMGSDASADIKVDLSDTTSVEERLQSLGEAYPEIKGLVHLYPLNAYLGGAGTDSHEIDASVKSFFLMVRQLLPLLDRPDGLISTLTFESIVFPYADSPGNIHPVFGALAGMLKTMNKELKNTLVKAVDFSISDPLEQVDAIVDQYMAELMTTDRHVETGYRDHQKYTLSLVEKAVEHGRSLIKKGDTVLVTGGARGITFEILKALATDYGVRLIILGRSDIHALEADFKRDGADEAYIFGCLKSRMKGAKPVAIKRAVTKIMALKEGLANLAALSSRGVDVQYHCVDVLDAEAVLKVVASVSPIDGVLHAAGVEESQFIQKKSLDSFNRVFDTKITGARNLLASLDDKAYRFFLTFSSVTAKFGNEGQVDYTGANDMLAKMLLKEKARHPEKMYKVFDWTAWDGAGMATKETVKKVLEQRGLEFLPLARGVKFFMDELYDAGSIEAVFTGRDTALDPDGLFQIPGLPAGERPGPFIDQVVTKGAVHAQYARTLDLTRDLFLLDHSRLDVPIFLGATGIEAMAEAASTLAPKGSRLVSMHDFSIPYGIKLLKGRAKEILINARQHNDDAHGFACSISSQFKNPQGQAMGDPKRHYQGDFAFSVGEPEQVGITIPEFTPVQYDGNIQDLLYHPSRLFMNGLFRTVEDILSFESQVLISKVRNSSQRPFFAGDTAPDFITDVAIVDAMFQTGGMLEVMTTHEIVLPARIRQMNFYGSLQKNKAYLCITRKTDNGPKANTYQLDLVDTDGLLLIRIEDFEMVKVDRLAPENRITDKISSPALKKAS